MSTAADHWAEQLGAWAIPEDILEMAPRSPHGFSVERFRRRAERARELDTPSRRHATEVLAEGGSVLDVGCGAGAGSLPLVPPAGHLIGVDENPAMLELFADAGTELGVRHEEHAGRWPDVADTVPTADVAISHHVLYNVPDLDGFLRALTGHARRRVVVEIPVRHPLSWMNPYWEQEHDVARPEGPVLDDLLAVVRSLGMRPNVERWEQRFILADEPRDEVVALVRRRLCLPPERDGDVRALVEAHPPPTMRPIATLWWDGHALSASQHPSAARVTKGSGSGSGPGSGSGSGSGSGEAATG